MSNLTVHGLFSNLFDDGKSRYERVINVRVCWRCGHEGGRKEVARRGNMPNSPMFCIDKLDCYSRKLAAKPQSQAGNGT